MKCHFHWWRKPETTDRQEVTEETFTHRAHAQYLGLSARQQASECCWFHWAPLFTSPFVHKRQDVSAFRNSTKFRTSCDKNPNVLMLLSCWTASAFKLSEWVSKWVNKCSMDLFSSHGYYVLIFVDKCQRIFNIDIIQDNMGNDSNDPKNLWKITWYSRRKRLKLI